MTEDNIKRSQLIDMLQDAQNKYGYVPKKVIEKIAKELDIFPVDIYGVLTFYAQFSLEPKGKHIIKVCQGTACHVMGSKEILDHLSNKLEIKEGQTTEDGRFSLERVACLGCCGMAPVVVIDDKFHGRCNIKKAEKLIEDEK